jgi:two-component system LytT family response regulator
MPILNCVIVDDENFAIELLADHVKLFQELSLIKTFTDPIKALIEIKKEDKIDILFLDIDMPGLTGLELASKLRPLCKYLIFTTAFSKYALEAFGVKANDYLLKPIDKRKFIESIQALIMLETPNAKIQSELLFVKSSVKGKFVAIRLSEVILIYVEGHKLFIITGNNRYETADSLKNIAFKLTNDERFLKVHNSNIINLRKILKIDGNTIELEGKYKVPLSESHKAKLLNTLGLDTKGTSR